MRLDETPPADPGSWATSEASRRTMLGNRGRDTRPELELRRALRGLGLAGYRLRWPVPGAPRRSIDVAYVGRRLAIMVDGCVWHGCPDHGMRPKGNAEYWSGKIARNEARDRSTDGLLAGAGWTVVRFWTHDSMDECAERVSGILRTLAR